MHPIMPTIEASRTTGEREALRNEVERFVRRTLAPLVARHQAPLDPATLAQILEEAEAFGLAGTDGSPTGLAPWEDLEAGEPPAATVDILTRIARASAAVAMAIHQRALARVVSRVARLASPGPAPAIAIEGTLGLGRTALAHLLAGTPLDEEDRAIMSDLYAPDAERTLVLEPAPTALLTPVFTGEAMAWQLHDRPSLTLVPQPGAHGLEELCLAQVRGATASARSDCSPDALAQALSSQMLAFVAIALGAVERAYDTARAFAAQRRQGGVGIDRHPAVLGLLGQTRRAVDSVRLELETLASEPLALQRIGPIAAFRADAHVRLAEAAHAAMQVAGGLGYMRETGLEKVARDVNALRVLAGAPPELALFAAEWERIHG
jgi:hypothetical protein